MCLDALSFLPRFVVVKTAKSSDAVVAHTLCANLVAGEIVVFENYRILTKKSNCDLLLCQYGMVVFCI